MTRLGAMFGPVVLALELCALRTVGTPISQQQAMTLEAATRSLIDEARQSQREGTLVRSQPNFARECAAGWHPTALAERMLRPVHSNAFIDAYVRWQLTGFEPTVDALAMNERGFIRMVEDLPDFLENPRAEQRLIESLNRIAQAGPLSADEQQSANDLLNDLARCASRAAALNVPAAEVRAWMDGRFSGQHHRAAMLALEEIIALAAAGWPVDQAKAALDRQLEQLAKSRAFTVEHRQAFVAAASRAVTTGRVIVAAAGIAGETLSVEYASVGIFDFDVARWERLLRPV